MDIDLPPTIPQLSFSLLYPLPFRILALTFLTILGFGTNLHILSSLGIDTSAVLDIRLDHPSSSSGAGGASQLVHPSKLFRPLYKLASAGLGLTGIGWVGYRIMTKGLGEEERRDWVWFPALVAMGLIGIGCLPLNVACRRQRYMFLRSLRRIVSPNLFKTVPFSDVILADILTSSAKVLGDVWLAGCLLYSSASASASSRGGSKEELGGGSCGRIWGVPLMVSLPYIFRFRQCLSEVLTKQTPTPRRSLLNALKYATAFPVILLSAMQTVVGDPFDDDEGRELKEAGERWIGRTTLFNLWVLAVLINSLYSFWWDITNDWGLSLLVPSGWRSSTSSQSSYQLIPRHPPSSSSSNSRSTSTEPTLHTRSRSTLSPTPPSSLHPSRTSRHTRAFSTAQSPNTSYPFLRPILLLPDPTIYYLAIALDLLLRFTWSLKLSPHLHEIGELEEGVFGMELLEVLRRWGWVYLRIEWEAVRKGQGGDGFFFEWCRGVSWLERGEGERRLRAAEEYELEIKGKKNGVIQFAREEEEVGVAPLLVMNGKNGKNGHLV